MRWCDLCTRYLHPALEACPGCGSTELGEREVSGEGTVVAVSVVEHTFLPSMPAPYVVALGWIAVSARRHAAGNPQSLYAEPLDLDGYHGARAISSPFGRYDCDVPCDGAVAVVVSGADAARDLRHPRVLVEAAGTRISEVQSWDQGTLTHQTGVFGPAAHLWERSTLTTVDVDVACLYDGFTFNTVSWLEALGFCELGESPDFVKGAERIGPGGTLPINPHGGQLTAGRSNGHGGLLEAVLQLRGTAGGRQVPDAEVAVVTSGGGIPGCALLLTTDR